MSKIGNVFSLGASGASDAASAQKKAGKKFIKTMNSLQEEFELFSSDAVDSFQTLSDNFDPYDLQNEYDSLYEAVIQPMETSFRENILPALRSGYSGGALGSAMFSGGREFTEAQARADLDMNKAMLKYQAREGGIARNFQEYDRRRGDLGLQYDIGSKPIQTAVEVAKDTYGARTDTIAAEAAASQAWGNLIPGWSATAANVASAVSGGGSTPAPTNANPATAGANPLQTAMGPVPVYSSRSRQPIQFPVG